jgi:hypothetical protein
MTIGNLDVLRILALVAKVMLCLVSRAMLIARGFFVVAESGDNNGIISGDDIAV